MKIFKFPAGETGVQFQEGDGPLGVIDARKHDNGMDLMGIAQVKRISGEDALYLPYIPYARQDRDMPEAGMCNAMKCYGNLLNSLGFKDVISLDPHSDVAAACIDNLHTGKDDYLEFIVEALNPLNLGAPAHINMVIPDSGATKKANALARDLFQESINVTLHQATKHRDMTTGNITGINTDITKPLKGPVYVIDDICDGGRTFTELALAIAPYVKKKDLHLIVTHGIFSKGLADLKEYYQTITTTDSFNRGEHYAYTQDLSDLRRFIEIPT